MILHILECDNGRCERTSAVPMEREWNAIANAEEDGWYVEDKPGGGYLTYCPDHHPRLDIEPIELTPSCVNDLVNQIGDRDG